MLWFSAIVLLGYLVVRWGARFPLIGERIFTDGRAVNRGHYIDNQEEHLRYRTIQEEYQDLLQEFAVSFDKKYLFHEPQ